MPDAPAPGSARAKGPLGQPWWVWGVAGAATIAAAIYLYRKRAAQTAAASTTAGQTIQAGSFYGWLLNQQSSPGPATKPGTPTCPKGWAYDADSKKCIPEKHKKKGHKGKTGPKAAAAQAAPASTAPAAG